MRRFVVRDITEVRFVVCTKLYHHFFYRQLDGILELQLGSHVNVHGVIGLLEVIESTPISSILGM